ncbi:MAG: GTP pyrophosphokinase family protein [Firmicutes bacterium]|nr:GTP pyrophosphokinase family protein [Bacillota bacterium]
MANQKGNIQEYISEKTREILVGRLSSEKFRGFLKENTRKVETMFTYYHCALMEVETKFKVLNEELSLSRDHTPIETIKTRLKSMDSLVEKVERCGVGFSVESIMENINDIAGIRIICSFQDDIYSLVDSFLGQDDITLIEKKDYIANPKENGYRSLHLIVSVPIYLEKQKRDMKVEVQFRTIAMDFWASLEHKIKYKKDIPESKSTKLVNELKLCADITADLDRKMQEIRQELAEV